MFLGVVSTIFLNFSINPFLPQLRIRSIQIVIIMSFVVISNVVIKRVDCIEDLFCQCHQHFMSTQKAKRLHAYDYGLLGLAVQFFDAEYPIQFLHLALKIHNEYFSFSNICRGKLSFHGYTFCFLFFFFFFFLFKI